MNNKSSHTRQLPLDLAHIAAFGAQDFFLSKSNEYAVKLIEDWPHWAQYGQLLIGPAASGKSHLINVWRLRSNAHALAAKDLNENNLQLISQQKTICIEDIDRGLANQEQLFHLLNLVNVNQGHLLLTSRRPISQLDVTLKDLRSRLVALPSVSINTPDEHLLKAVMVKQFADRQLAIEPQLVEYLFKRMERSMLAVAELVELLDRGSLGAGRAITIPLARQILLNYAGTALKK